jgi:hypothetical protein
MAKPAVLKKYNSQFELLVPRHLTEDPDKGREISQKIKKFYFGDTPISQETLFQYVDVSTNRYQDYKVLSSTQPVQYKIQELETSTT